jgi:hypothetical protein
MVRNRYQPEACMATRYLAEEALSFVTYYTALSPYTKRRIWDMEEDERFMEKAWRELHEK